MKYLLVLFVQLSLLNVHAQEKYQLGLASTVHFSERSGIGYGAHVNANAPIFVSPWVHVEMTIVGYVHRMLASSVLISNRWSWLTQKKIRGAIRIAGVGGVFGYYGSFANFSIGKMTWYVTRRDKPVLVKTTGNKNFIFTPDDPGDFITELSS